MQRSNSYYDSIIWKEELRAGDADVFYFSSGRRGTAEEATLCFLTGAFCNREEKTAVSLTPASKSLMDVKITPIRRVCRRTDAVGNLSSCQRGSKVLPTTNCPPQELLTSVRTGIFLLVVYLYFHCLVCVSTSSPCSSSVQSTCLLLVTAAANPLCSPSSYNVFPGV